MKKYLNLILVSIVLLFNVGCAFYSEPSGADTARIKIKTDFADAKFFSVDGLPFESFQYREVVNVTSGKHDVGVEIKSAPGIFDTIHTELDVPSSGDYTLYLNYNGYSKGILDVFQSLEKSYPNDRTFKYGGKALGGTFEDEPNIKSASFSVNALKEIMLSMLNNKDIEPVDKEAIIAQYVVDVRVNLNRYGYCLINDMHINNHKVDLKFKYKITEGKNKLLTILFIDDDVRSITTRTYK